MTEPPESRDRPLPRMTPRTEPADLPADAVPHTEPFLCDLEIAPHEVSRAIPHVTNVEYVRWLDRAAELHSDSLGYTRRQMLDDGRMWFVARHEIDYLAEAWPGDRLVVATWVRDFDRVKSWRDYLILRPHDATPVCRAATLWVYVDLSRRRPVRVPEPMVRAFQPLTVRRGRRAGIDS
ncbi:MAG: acyl-CoA thioesterase [Planctomycetota bacterium]|jgi:acyl-CoA thioester hydrolase